jgi:hypothetical protein
MLYLETLKRQHTEIKEILAELKQNLNNEDISKDAFSIAAKISNLAGKLKIHLNTEDRYMYPQLFTSTNAEIQRTAKAYYDEMGTISSDFMAFKDKYNTRTKIINEPHAFKREFKRMLGIIEDRMAKEDANLYNII